ncbi:hypothetical protein [Streptomyces brasiliensis]|uniref:Uncharacterized protein n=1 Tax=Streptomyces brasiliensis TaxID=1954 RepID=A0A917NS33_9ACTN|nr:hypothetical protein [Streptomyces brasiliensis]GGJ24497.1 hypothetical protein GCM10010121_039460 [Streptomyces brasiliensis]
MTAAGGAHGTAGTSVRFVPWVAVGAGLAVAAGTAAAVVVVRLRRRRTADAAVERPDKEVELTGAVT